MAGPRCYLQFSKIGPTTEDLVISYHHWLAEKLRFLGDLRRPTGSLSLLLGDHLVTMGVCIKPWGASWAPSVVLVGPGSADLGLLAPWPAKPGSPIAATVC